MKRKLLKDFERVHEIPFQANRRRMSIMVESDDHRILISKGAPESILSISTKIGNGIEAQPMSQANEKVNSLIEKYSQNSPCHSKFQDWMFS